MARGAVHAVLLLSVLGAGCLSPTEPSEFPPSPATGIGPEGASIEAPGVRLEFPPGAVRQAVAVTVGPTDVPTPVGHQRIGGRYLLGPEGTAFEQPVKLTFSLDQPLADGATVKVATAPLGSTDFELLEANVVDGRVVATTRHFSTVQPVLVLPEDAGTTEDAGRPEDAGTTEDAGATEDAGTTEDAGVDAGVLCSPTVDAGLCSYIVPSSSPTVCRFEAYCAVGRQMLTCVGSTCTCDWRGTQTTFSAPYDCSQRTMLERWTCDCGFAPRPTGPAVCVAPGTNASDGGAPSYSLPVGASCPGGQNGGQSCMYGLCFNMSSGWTCSKWCANDNYCPCGWRCSQFYPSAESYACVPF